METKELIKELRILEKSSKLGERACICGEAANRLEELQQEIEIARRLEKIKDRRLNPSSDTSQRPLTGRNALQLLKLS